MAKRKNKQKQYLQTENAGEPKNPKETVKIKEKGFEIQKGRDLEEEKKTPIFQCGFFWEWKK